jgi:hypothetical protein
MMLHPRYKLVETARYKVREAVYSIEEDSGLTFGETMSILGDMIADRAKYAIRIERHGNDSKKGDEA